MTSESTELEPYRVDGELITTGDIRQDLRDRKTDSWTDVVTQVALFAQSIAPTLFVPRGLRDNPAAVTGAIMYGREIGFPPMTALQVLHNIDGKVSMSAEGQRALVLQAGHEIVTSESTSAKCVMKGRRKGSTEWTTTTWTIDDARNAGLVNKDNWKKYPRAMLVARASADLCRLAFPDVIRGLMAVEELEDVVAISSTGEVVPPTGDEAPPTVQRKPRKKAEKAPKAEAPKADLPEDAPELPEDTSPASDGKGESTSGSSEPDSPDGSGDASTPPASPEPSPDVEVVDEESSEPLASKAQVQKIVIQFNAKGITDKAERLYTTSLLIGRQIESANDLTAKEAHSLIDTFESCETPEDFQKIVSATADAAEKKGGE